MYMRLSTRKFKVAGQNVLLAVDAKGVLKVILFPMNPLVRKRAQNVIQYVNINKRSYPQATYIVQEETLWVWLEQNVYCQYCHSQVKLWPDSLAQPMYISPLNVLVAYTECNSKYVLY